MVKETGTVYVGNGTTPTVHAEVEASPEDKLEELVQTSDLVLCRVKNVFPFDIFPDSLVVSLTEVEITYRYDFITQYVYPVPIDKVLTVRVLKGLFFASLEIEVQGHENDPTKIKYLKKSQAEEAKLIIMGLRTAMAQEIDLKAIPQDQLIEKLKHIAQTSLDNPPAVRPAPAT